MRETWIAACAALLTIAGSSAAQTAATPGQVIDGKVIVKVYVTLSDEAEPYHPLARFPISLHGVNGTVRMTTDDVGVVTTALVAGDYRLVSDSAYGWRGRQYRWNLPLTVAPRMDIVDLTSKNADVGDPTALAAADALNAARRVTPPAVAREQADARADDARMPVGAPAPQPYLYKDPGTAQILSFLITGGGQMYAGEAGKGLGLLLIGAGSAVAGAAASTTECSVGYYSSSCDNNLAPFYAGLGIAAFTWIYGIATADDAAHRHNARQGFPTAPQVAGPYVAPGGAGATQVGVSVSPSGSASSSLSFGGGLALAGQAYTGDDADFVDPGVGVDAHVRAGYGPFSLGAGVLYFEHDVEGADFSALGGYAEPRVTLSRTSSVQPYLAGRYARVRLKIALDPELGIGDAATSTNAYGGGVGVLFSVGRGMQADFGVLGLHYPEGSGATTVVAKLGLGFGRQ
jgi:hypothetical protein